MRQRREKSRKWPLKYRHVSRAILLAAVCVALYSTYRSRSTPLPVNQGQDADLELGLTLYADVGENVVLADARRAVPPPDATKNSDENPFGLDHALLHHVIDKTTTIPHRPYFHLVDVATRSTPEAMRKHAQGEDRVTYSNLWTQPELHRGELVYLEGHLRGLVPFEATEDEAMNPSGLTKLYQGDLFTSASHPRPYVVIMPNIPPGMPQGLGITENVTFVGFFLKTWRYTSAGDVQRAAPLLIGHMVSWKRTPPPTTSSPVRAYIGVGLAVAIAVVVGGVWWLNRGRKHAPHMHPGGEAMDAHLTEKDLMANLAQLEKLDLPDPLALLEKVDMHDPPPRSTGESD